jgi:phosphatidate cytidylyltransferase
MPKPKPLALRLSVAAWGIPLIVLLIFFGGWLFSLFVAVISAIALFEFYTLAETRHMNPQKFPAALMAFIVVFLAAFISAGPWIVIMFLLALVLAFLDIRFGENNAWRDLPLTIFGWLYIPLLLGTLVYVRGAVWDDGVTSYSYTLYLITAIWICDTAAYAGGKALGKHKLAPYVSPNKTWEGAFFGLAGAVLWAILWIPILRGKTDGLDLLYVALIVGIIGQLGDLIESYFKRSAGVKDAGNLLPEHGGALDRFDSLILSAPFVFIYQVVMDRISVF